MSEKKPFSNAVDALERAGVRHAQLRGHYAEAVLGAAVEDREGLEEVIRKHSKRRVVLGTWECMECGERLPTLGSPHLANVSAHQADAVVRWLTGGGA